jgi:hypothetical protein
MSKRVLAAAAVLAAACLGATAPSPSAYGAGGSASPSSAPTTRHVCAKPTSPKQVTCFAIARTDSRQPTRTPGGIHPFTTPSGYGPADLQSAYGLPAGDPDPARPVAIVDAYGAPNLASDLATYRAQYGLPACTTGSGCLKIVNQSGQASPLPPGDVSWAQETSLDVDMVSAACPKCSILVVQANSGYDSDIYAAVSTAINLNAKFVSLSWGKSESSSETSLDSYLNHTDVAITAATGDQGFGVVYPAASPYAIAVGGTTLTRASNARGWTEAAWPGAGSGCSAYEAKPAFQNDSGCARRTVADVSAIADPATGVAVYDTYGNYGWEVVGGTSVSAPIIASVYALAGLPIGNAHANSYPYSNPGFLWDVTSGSNGSCGSYLCNGVTGYDGPTGLGTPHGNSSFWAPDSDGGKTGYTACSGENSVCPASGRIAYGANGQYTYLTSSGSIACDNATFGDPSLNHVKACYTLPLGSSGGPAGYAFCSGEGGTCGFSGTASVAYGANGQFNFRGATGSIGCDNGTFTDPAPNVAKSCYYLPLTSSGGPAGFTWCASENGTCTFSGSAQVAFGANGQYSYRAAVGSMRCDTTTLGDPILGTVKNCYYQAS